MSRSRSSRSSSLNFAFIPSAGAILVAEIFGKRDWLYHAVAGGVVAVVVLGLFWQSPSEIHAVSDTLDLEAGPGGSNQRLALLVVGAGMVGGVANWLVAGRLAGNWRDTARPDAISPER